MPRGDAAVLVIRMTVPSPTHPPTPTPKTHAHPHTHTHTHTHIHTHYYYYYYTHTHTHTHTHAHTHTDQSLSSTLPFNSAVLFIYLFINSIIFVFLPTFLGEGVWLCDALVESATPNLHVV